MSETIFVHENGRRDALIPRKNSLTQEDIKAIKNRTGRSPIPAPDFDAVEEIAKQQNFARRRSSNQTCLGSSHKKRRHSDEWDASITVNLKRGKGRSSGTKPRGYPSKVENPGTSSTNFQFRVTLARKESDCQDRRDSLGADILHPSELEFSWDRADLGTDTISRCTSDRDSSLPQVTCTTCTGDLGPLLTPSPQPERSFRCLTDLSTPHWNDGYGPSSICGVSPLASPQLFLWGSEELPGRC